MRLRGVQGRALRLVVNIVIGLQYVKDILEKETGVVLFFLCLGYLKAIIK